MLPSGKKLMKTRIFMSFIIAMFLVCSGLWAGVAADETTDDKSQLTVPWDEFKKLVNLDEDEIVVSLETFQKLLAQTGVQTTPAHTLREGDVVLTRAEFKKLVDQMQPPEGPAVPPPFDYLITKSVYFGKMQNDNTTFTAAFNVHVLKKSAYLKIPLLPQSIALQDITVDGKGALVVSEGGYHTVVLSKMGQHDVTASFSLKSSLEKGKNGRICSRTTVLIFTTDGPTFSTAMTTGLLRTAPFAPSRAKRLNKIVRENKKILLFISLLPMAFIIERLCQINNDLLRCFYPAIRLKYHSNRVRSKKKIPPPNEVAPM